MSVSVNTIFEISAMPFPCSGLLICCANIPKVLLMFFNKLASFSIPYLDGLESWKHCSKFFSNVHQYKQSQYNESQYDTSKEKEKKIAKTNFLNQLGHF